MIFRTIFLVLIWGNDLASPSSLFDLDLNDARPGTLPACSGAAPSGSAARAGVCVFSLACAHSGGVHLGVCRNGFLFSSCCYLKNNPYLNGESRPPRPPTGASLAGGGDDNDLPTSGHDDEDVLCGTRGDLGLKPFRHLDGSYRHSRIVGGREAKYGSWPWQVSLFVRYYNGARRHRCGGVLVDPHWVVTAAHCVDGYSLDELVLVFGDHDKDSPETETVPQVERRPDRVVVHKDFDPIYYESDIALVFVGEAVAYTDVVRPVCLPPHDKKGEEQVVSDVGYVTGWGTTTEGGSKPRILREVRVSIIDHEFCNALFLRAGGGDEGLTDVFICAGDVDEGGADACEGDSGGPLVAQSDDGRWTLAGIVSWGDGCGQRNKMGVYTNVAKFARWIRRNIKRSRVR